MLRRFFRRWRDRHRLLFHFHDGRRHRTADPLAVWAALEAHPRYKHSRDFGPAMAGDEDRQAAAVEAVCDAFDVDPLADDGSYGMTVAERLGLLDAFDAYTQRLRAGLGIDIGRRTQPASQGSPPAATAGASQ